MAGSSRSSFKLSATLAGHTSDVRAVLLPDPLFAITASRDGSTRIWKQKSSTPPAYDPSESSHGAQFKTCLAYLHPTKQYPDGLILSSGQDTLIEARQPDTTADRNADGLLLGHSNQVCSLDVHTSAGYIVSGSWDKTARLWEVGKWESEIELQGHTASVWAVIAYDKDTVVTGCADRAIRVFDLRGKLQVSFDGKDIVRALAKLPEGHASGGQIVSASNDGVIRIWTLKGQLIAELFGHESFIYSLSVLSSGEIISSGEDRTVRIWQGTECVQVVTLPAISVWSVSACPNGDFIVGSSDKMARIFTRSEERTAEAAAISEFEEAVQSSAVPRQQLDDNSQNYPGPDFLQQKSGTKEGQHTIIREADGSNVLYQWSMQAQQWVKVGEVVDSAGSSTTKQSYMGREYDYVFDIDIEDGKPALKLPYNVTQNPYEAATKFLQDNELPIGYLEETANFIIKNTQGASLGQSQPSGPDPWGTESRYRPGEVPTSTYQPPPPPPPKASLPHKDYLSITVGKPSAAFKQVTKVNTEYQSSDKQDLAVSSDELEALQSTSEQLEKHNFSTRPSLPSSSAVERSIAASLKIATQWQPPGNRLAGLDLLRFFAAALTDIPDTSTVDLVKAVLSSGAFNADFLRSNTKLAMISLRLFLNLLYGSPSGRTMIQSNLDDLFERLSAVTSLASTDSPLAIALTTFYLNLAVFVTADPTADDERKADRGLSILEEIVRVLQQLPAVDHKPDAGALSQTTEPAYRGLMALGTVIVGFKHREEIVMAAKEVFDVPALLRTMHSKGWTKEPRFKNAIAEVRGVLG